MNMTKISNALIAVGSVGTLTTLYTRLVLFDRSNVALVLHEWGHSFGLEHCEQYGCLMNRSRSLKNLFPLIYNLDFCPEHKGELFSATENIPSSTKGLIFRFNYSGSIINITKVVGSRLQEILPGKKIQVEYCFVPHDYEIHEECIDRNYGYILMECIKDTLINLGLNPNDYKQSHLLAEINDRPRFDMGLWGLNWKFPDIYYQVCFSPLNHTSKGFLTSLLIPLGVLLR